MFSIEQEKEHLNQELEDMLWMFHKQLELLQLQQALPGRKKHSSRHESKVCSTEQEEHLYQELEDVFGSFINIVFTDILLCMCDVCVCVCV